MQISELLHAAELPQNEAELLLARVLSVPREYLLTHSEAAVSPGQQAEFTKLIARRRAGEPLAQILGEKEFMGLRFEIDQTVLIPRPETEQLVETVIQEVVGGRWQVAENKDPCSLLDVGTGSGCIAIALAYHLPNLKVTACDISPAALQIARKNAVQHKVQIQFYESDLLDSVRGEYQIVVANLPYIAETDPAVDPAVRKFEPHLALFAGSNGLELYERLLGQIAAWQSRPKLFLGEVGWQQGAAMYQLAEKYLPGSQIEILKDLAGHDRIVKIIN